MEQSVSTYKKIRRLYRQSQKYAASRMEQPDLTQSELQLLRHVGFHGEVSQRHLADEMGVDKAMISRILQKLEAKGYLVRRENPADGRSQLLYATEQADQLKNSKASVEALYYEWLAEALSEEELEEFCRLLEILYRRSKEESKAGFPTLTRLFQERSER